ncbi:GNAT family N-acetyltransferase [Ramlibacter algicola]|uniref:GNAT family N-acetyltransferase n=1 Tax=Ramlibacter algicola TaxID=2795217 RepID=UPI003B847FD3
MDQWLGGVAPAHEGAGRSATLQGHEIGSTLIEVAVDACRCTSPRGYIGLNTSQNAIGFYRRLGFRDVFDAPPPR